MTYFLKFKHGDREQYVNSDMISTWEVVGGKVLFCTERGARFQTGNTEEEFTTAILDLNERRTQEKFLEFKRLAELFGSGRQ